MTEAGIGDDVDDEPLRSPDTTSGLGHARAEIVLADGVRLRFDVEARCLHGQPA